MIDTYKLVALQNHPKEEAAVPNQERKKKTSAVRVTSLSFGLKPLGSEPIPGVREVCLREPSRYGGSAEWLRREHNECL